MTRLASPTRRALALYVSGASPRSTQAIDAIRQVCVEVPEGRVDLQIVGVADRPDSSMRKTLVVRDQILAVPTLVKRLPLPLPPRRACRRPLSEITWVRVGLDLESPDPEPEPEPEHNLGNR